MPVPKDPISITTRFTWYGDRLNRQMAAAIRAALREVGDDMEETAKELVHVDTGALQESIIATIPRRRGGVYVINFGSFTIPYAYWQEVLPEPIGKPYIRPAVDMHFWRIDGLVRDNLWRFANAVIDFDIGITEEGFDQWP